MPAKSTASLAASYAELSNTHGKAAPDSPVETMPAPEPWSISRMLWVAALVSGVLWAAIGLVAWQVLQLVS